MTMHTPGSWMILGTPVSPIPPEMFPVLIGVEDAEGGLPIMAVHNINGDYGDARLVAAAPDLLEALQYAVEQVPELGSVPGISAAIARATGEQP